MGLLEQIRFLDQLVYDHRARAAFRAAPATAVAALAAEDRPLFLGANAQRLEAFAADVASKIDGRWYGDRFPATLVAAGRLLGGDRRRAVLELMSHPAFAHAIGEDETGAAVAALALDLADAHGAPWLKDLVLYEWLVSVGLPARATVGTLSLPAALAGRTHRLVELATPPAGATPRLAFPTLHADFDHDAPAIVEAILLGIDVTPVREPTRLWFCVANQRVDEFPDQAALGAVLAALAAGDPSLAARAAADPDQAGVLDFLAAEGLLADPSSC